MLDSNIDLVRQVLQNALGDDAEFFSDVHCPDPFDNKQEFSFPVVAVHATGVYLVLCLNDSEDGSEPSTERLDYACRVFKSYFFTKIPIRSLLLFRVDRKSSICESAGIYDCGKRMLISDCAVADSLPDYVAAHIENDDVYPKADETVDLISRLSKEHVNAAGFQATESGCYVKKGSQWAPAFSKDSNKVFRLALFGGMFGVHRFYLRLFGSGLLYMVTFGLFGVGWLFDCAEMVLGGWKHKGVYLLPLKNRKRCGIELVLAVSVWVVVLVSMARI